MSKLLFATHPIASSQQTILSSRFESSFLRISARRSSSSTRGKERKTAVYARVSSNKQKADLERQTNRILRYAATHGIKIDNITEEIASGMNGNQPKLNKLLADGQYDIIIEHRERLTRFAFEAIENALKAQNSKIIVIDDKEIDDDLVRDVTEVLMSFCARLYGRREARNRTDASRKTLQGGDDENNGS